MERTDLLEREIRQLIARLREQERRTAIPYARRHLQLSAAHLGAALEAVVRAGDGEILHVHPPLSSVPLS